MSNIKAANDVFFQQFFSVSLITANLSKKAEVKCWLVKLQISLKLKKGKKMEL